MNFVIYTETTADLPSELIQEAGLHIIPMEFMLDNQTFVGSDALDPKDLYAAMRQGKKTSTSQIAPQTYIDLFQKHLEQGTDILYLAFSSGLSGSYNSAVMAREELLKQYPERKIEIIDTLSASMGEGMIAYKTGMFALKNKSLDEVATYSKNLVPNLCHLFTVDDLNHLHRGGRLSKTSAILGTLLHLKPLLKINEEGKIVPFGKVIGRNKAIQALIDKMFETIHIDENDFIMIGHGDCLEEAQEIGKKITERFKVKTIHYNFIGTVIGSHSGPGTIAIFYVGSNRKV